MGMSIDGMALTPNESILFSCSALVFIILLFAVQGDTHLLFKVGEIAWLLYADRWDIVEIKPTVLRFQF